MIPVVGFATLTQFAKANRLVESIDYPVEHLVVIDNSGTGSYTPPVNEFVKHTWVLPIPFGLGLVGAWNLIVKSTPYAPYWVLINDDAWFEPGALQIIAEQADPDALNFLDVIPAWSAVVFGEDMVNRVGLYDERFYPLYFDDNDLERRVEHHKVPVNHIPAKIGHENSSTLKSGFEVRNSITFAKNQTLFDLKAMHDDYSQGFWSLAVRRANRWD